MNRSCNDCAPMKAPFGQVLQLSGVPGASGSGRPTTKSVSNRFAPPVRSFQALRLSVLKLASPMPPKASWPPCVDLQSLQFSNDQGVVRYILLVGELQGLHVGFGALAVLLTLLLGDPLSRIVKAALTIRHNLEPRFRTEVLGNILGRKALCSEDKKQCSINNVEMFGVSPKMLFSEHKTIFYEQCILFGTKCSVKSTETFRRNVRRPAFGGNHAVIPLSRFMTGDTQYPLPLKRESSGAMATWQAPKKHLCNSKKYTFNSTCRWLRLAPIFDRPIA